MRRALLTLALLVACEPATVTPSATPSEPSSATPSATATLAAQPTPAPYAYALVYVEFFGEDEPSRIRIRSLDRPVTRELGTVAPKHDARLALSPDTRRLAVLDKEDHDVERTSTWRLRLIDLDGAAERELIAPRTDPDPLVPWDVGWSPDGALLLASRQALERVETDGSRVTVERLPDTTVGVTFRDPAHPGLLVAQSKDALSVYRVESSDRALKIVERGLVGVAEYALRPGTRDIIELVTRFDGVVTLSLIHDDGTVAVAALAGPRVEGLVELVGATADSVFVLWPLARDDPAALKTLATAFLYRGGYDGALRVVDGTRNWGEYGPLGVSPDGRALLVPVGNVAGTAASFAIDVCCERRPAPRLLDFGDRAIVGWTLER